MRRENPSSASTKPKLICILWLGSVPNHYLPTIIHVWSESKAFIMSCENNVSLSVKLFLILSQFKITICVMEIMQQNLLAECQIACCYFDSSSYPHGCQNNTNTSGEQWLVFTWCLLYSSSKPLIVLEPKVNHNRWWALFLWGIFNGLHRIDRDHLDFWAVNDGWIIWTQVGNRLENRLETDWKQVGNRLDTDWKQIVMDFHLFRISNI